MPASCAALLPAVWPSASTMPSSRQSCADPARRCDGLSLPEVDDQPPLTRTVSQARVRTWPGVACGAMRTPVM